MKKGFSLVELIAVITILVVITLLATSGYRLIHARIQKTNYENKVSYIETKAVEYAEATGRLTMNVDQLVKEGLLVADDEEGRVINPINGESMNCHLVYISDENGNSYGHYTEEEECDPNHIVGSNTYVELKAYQADDNNEITNINIEDEWVRTNVFLVAELGEVIDSENIVKLIWFSNVGKEERDIHNDFLDKNKFLVSAEQIVNSMYSLEIYMKDGTVYQTQKMVKIDKQRPMIYDNEVLVDKKEEWSTEKEILVKASDGNGSGIYGYSIGVSNDCVHANYTFHEENVFTYSVLENGTYYICVKDHAGNVSEDVSSKSVTIETIDKEAPIVTVKKNPLTLGTEDYEMKANLEVVWSTSGEGIISCNPTISKKTGIYDVNCIVTGNNGLSKEVNFTVKHSYPATYHYCSRTERVCDSCKQVQDCESWCVGVCSDVACTNCCCKWEHGDCKWVTSCEGCRDVEVDCSYYTCPSGGNLKGSTCYY